jgi:hypothetical protein
MEVAERVGSLSIYRISDCKVGGKKVVVGVNAYLPKK